MHAQILVASQSFWGVFAILSNSSDSGFGIVAGRRRCAGPVFYAASCLNRRRRIGLALKCAGHRPPTRKRGEASVVVAMRHAPAAGGNDNRRASGPWSARSMPGKPRQAGVCGRYPLTGACGVRAADCAGLAQVGAPPRPRRAPPARWLAMMLARKVIPILILKQGSPVHAVLLDPDRRQQDPH